MDLTFAELIRVVLTVAFVAGFAWTLSVMYRYYRTDGEPIRLFRVMRRLGIPPTTAGEAPFTYHLPTAARLCYFCQSKPECDAWFAEGGKAAAPPAFCANAGFLHLVMNETRAYAPGVRR